MKNIIVFGSGINFSFLLMTKAFRKDVNIISVIDNDYSNIGNNIYNIQVCSPEAINNMTYDIIVVTSKRNYKSMISQLLNYNVSEDCIVLSDEFENKTYFNSKKKRQLWKAVFGRNVINELDFLHLGCTKYDKDWEYVYAEIPIELVHVDMTVYPNDYYKDFFEKIQKNFPSNINCHIYSSTNIEFLEYVLGKSKKYPKEHLEFFNQADLSEDLLNIRKDFVRSLDVDKLNEPTETPIVLKYQKLKSRFNIIDGTHRISLLYLYGHKSVKAIIKIDEFIEYLNEKSAKVLLSFLKENCIKGVYPPIFNPLFTAFNNSEVSVYREEVMILLRFFRNYSIANKTAIDLRACNGFMSRVLRRLGLSVLSVEDDKQNLVLCQLIGDLENTPLNVFNKEIKEIPSDESYDIAVMLISEIETIIEKLNNEEYLRVMGELINEIFICKLPEGDRKTIKKILHNASFDSYQKLGKVVGRGHASPFEIGIFYK